MNYLNLDCGLLEINIVEAKNLMAADKSGNLIFYSFRNK